MPDQVSVNNIKGLLDSPVSAIATEIPSTGVHTQLTALGINWGFEYVLMTITQPSAETSWEVVRITGLGAGFMIVDRDVEGTGPEAWPTGSILSCRTTAGTVHRARRQIERILHAPDGTLLLDGNGDLLIGAEIE